MADLERLRHPVDERNFDIVAILDAFDMSSPEDQARMLAEVREKGDLSMSGQQLVRGAQAANLSRTMGVDREAGMHHLDSLEDAAQHIPGIKGVLALLAEPVAGSALFPQRAAQVPTPDEQADLMRRHEDSVATGEHLTQPKAAKPQRRKAANP